MEAKQRGSLHQDWDWGTKKKRRATLVAKNMIEPNKTTAIRGYGSFFGFNFTMNEFVLGALVGEKSSKYLTLRTVHRCNSLSS